VDKRGILVRFPIEVIKFSFFLVQAECGPKWYPIQLAQMAFSPGVKRPDREANHSPSSVMRLRMTGTVPPLRHMSSWLMRSKIIVLHKH
jgi:hypothetical protein